MDGTIALADLSPTALATLKLDVADEGAVVAADTSTINFTGAGVAVTSTSGVATVSITGAPASAILAGTMADWYDPTPPAGWYICDGSVKTDLAGTLGSRYGASAGTLPKIEPVVVDQYTTTVSDVVGSTQPGWRVDSVSARITQNMVTMLFQVTRTGSLIGLANPNYSDQALFASKAPYWPEFAVAAACSNSIRHIYMSAISGTVYTTAGVNNASFTNSNIDKDTVFQWSLSYPVRRDNTFPKVWTIIKAP